jgi:hypothetical protein
MRRPSTFKKNDVVRMIAAVHATGLEVARVEVRPDGLIVVVPGKPEETNGATNPWDKVLKDEATGQKRAS